MVAKGGGRVKAFLGFAGLSGGGWLLDCTLLLLLTRQLALASSLANAVSSCVAAGLVFTLSRLHVFDGRRSPAGTRTVLYLAYTGGVIALASAAMPGAELLARALADAAALDASPGQVTFVAKVLVTPPQLLCNFVVARHLSEHPGARRPRTP